MIEPSFFYLLHLVRGIRIILGITGLLLTVFGFCEWATGPMGGKPVMAIIGIVLLIILVLMPNRDTLILMKATKLASGYNVESICWSIKNIINQAAALL